MIANGIRVRSVFTQDCRPGAFSVVPAGLVSVGTHTQHCVLGYSQPSPSTSSGQALRDFVTVGLGTQDLRPGLLSAVSGGTT